MKTLLAILALAVSGCATTGPDPLVNARNAKLNATGSFIIQKTIDVAFQSVLNMAQSKGDSVAKSNYLDGLALGFRSQEGNLLTGDDVRKLVNIWTPEKPHWLELGGKLAGVYAKANPQTPEGAKMVLESIATGLNATGEK